MKPPCPLPLIALVLALVPHAGTSALAEPDLLVVVGVPETLESEVRGALDTLLVDDARARRVLDLAELERDEAIARRAGQVVALGVDACTRLALTEASTLCALLSAESFAAVPCADRCERLEAIVMDQPLSRQVAVASSVYPTLERFGVLSDSPRSSTAGAAGLGDAALAWRRFDATRPLPAQLSSALATSDALLALPESAIFNRSTLHVVLLTAYGYARPVIGYSRAFVRAGALISAYSTPEQVLRDVFDPRPEAVTRTRFDDPRMRSPTRFSIAENRPIARSLGLTRRIDVDTARDYSDADFPS